MKILVVGSGMYVTGRNGTGVGTLLASLAEISKKINIKLVRIVATAPDNAVIVSESAGFINRTLGTDLKVVYENISGDALIDIPNICSRDNYDCAIVSTPDHLHFAHTSGLLQKGVPCLIVKPLTPTVAEGLELERIRSTQKIHAAVEFHKRLDVTNLWIQKALIEKKLGKISYFTVDYSQKISIPTSTFAKWAEKTNIFQYLGVHYVDLIWFLTGFRPKKAMAFGSYGVLKERGINTWDAINASILWVNSSNPKDEFLSQFSVNWIDPNCTSALSDQKYKVVGTKGRIECDQKNRGVEFIHEKEGIQQINPYFSDFLPDQKGGISFCGYGFESVKQFILDIKALKAGLVGVDELAFYRPTIRQALVSTAVLEAVNLSLKNNSSWESINNEVF
ncbi:Gfo/Idh/MocA family oxidoreductase [Polynucleobacter paneuropaeus]|nr:Gfo/Idh/MocA family oxidoreductase [Polynucleobacter paneuropaeus]